MSKSILPGLISLLLLSVLGLAACAPAAPSTVVQPAETESPAEPVVPTIPAESELPAAAPTQPATSVPAPLPSPTALPTFAPPIATFPLATPTPILEERTVELEWPPHLRLGESDVVRLALIPSAEGYTAMTEFPEHQTMTQTVPVPRPGGYDLFAVARLDGVGFTISPQGDLVEYLPPDQAASWRWSLTPRNSGKQRISVTMRLRWVPVSGGNQPLREVTAFSRSLDVRVLSFFGLSQAQALLTGFVSLLLGGSLGLAVLVTIRPRKVRQALQIQAPNPELIIELPASLSLQPQEKMLLKSLFQRYARLLIEQEFLSGYSGARTFLALPIRHDGRADAYTIAKLGERESIRREYENYEMFVKDSLPPITARIQRPPVSAPEAPAEKGARPILRLTALQYTFIGEPGSSPTSLRQVLLEKLDPGLLVKLFDTFGPNWWMQRRPYTFRLAQEYDRLLPAHLVLEPVAGTGAALDGRTPPAELRLEVGDMVTLRNFASAELRPDGRSLSLKGHAPPGQPPMRVRWLGVGRPEGKIGRVVATRQSLLRQYSAGFELFGLPDPLDRLPALLSETIAGSQSTIHGDLNLENILVGPGNMLWLIDFAQTREGHALFDFAHLEAEIIAHVLAALIQTPQEYLEFLRLPAAAPFPALAGLTEAIHNIANRCLFNPAQPREYDLALSLACLGALKFTNLDLHARHLLFLTAACLIKE